MYTSLSLYTYNTCNPLPSDIKKVFRIYIHTYVLYICVYIYKYTQSPAVGHQEVIPCIHMYKDILYVCIYIIPIYISLHRYIQYMQTPAVGRQQ